MGFLWQVSFGEAGERTSSFSGGQKTMVALSLITAIQRCDPAPFYIFDEIDDHLDSVYAESLAKLLVKQAKSGAQVFTISFNPSVVRSADKCYGISFADHVRWFLVDVDVCLCVCVFVCSCFALFMHLCELQTTPGAVPHPMSILHSPAAAGKPHPRANQAGGAALCGLHAGGAGRGPRGRLARQAHPACQGRLLWREGRRP